MWRKRTELAHLKALRLAAHQAMQGQTLLSSKVILSVRVFAPVHAGDLDNFITGICDGLMAAHMDTPIDSQSWVDLPDEAKPDRTIVFKDDICINKIIVERIEPSTMEYWYEIEIEGE